MSKNDSSNFFNYAFTTSCTEIMLDSSYSASQKIILNFILHHINTNGQCFPSNEYLAKIASIEIQSVKNILRDFYARKILISSVTLGKRSISITET